MKVVGLITEYNPFHNGHLYHLNKSIEVSNADYVVCIMSGNFVQRGEPAIIDKWTRTEMALKNGVDLIIELPVTYALRSAEYFAYGSIQLLNKTGIVNKIVFGSEIGNIKPLLEISEVLAYEPDQLSNLIQEELQTGISFPEARANALQKYFTKFKNSSSSKQFKTILNNPNNILGIEYIKALIRTDSSIQPLTIKRKDANYHQTEIKGKITSATAIRKAILNNKELQNLDNVVPSHSYKILNESLMQNKGPISLNDFELSILTLLRRISSNQLQKIEDIIGGLENRIKDAANQTASLNKLISLIKTKRFTQTRIQRILIHLLLDLKKSLLQEFDKNGGPQYLRILGFTEKGQDLLKIMKDKAELPVVNRTANHYKNNYQPNSLKEKMLAYDIKATDIYSLAYMNKEYCHAGQDYKQPIILKNSKN